MLTHKNKRSIFRKYWDAWLFLGACAMAVLMGAWAFDDLRLPSDLAEQPTKSVAFLSESMPDLPVKYDGDVIGQVNNYQLVDGKVAMTFDLKNQMTMRNADARLVTDPVPAVELTLAPDAINIKRRGHGQYTVHFAYADVLPVIATAAGNDVRPDKGKENTDITQDFMDVAETMIIQVIRDLHRNFHAVYSYFFPSDQSENTDSSN
jgi:hypothetical protein